MVELFVVVIFFWGGDGCLRMDGCPLQFCLRCSTHLRPSHHSHRFLWVGFGFLLLVVAAGGHPIELTLSPQTKGYLVLNCNRLSGGYLPGKAGGFIFVVFVGLFFVLYFVFGLLLGVCVSILKKSHLFQFSLSFFLSLFFFLLHFRIVD